MSGDKPDLTDSERLHAATAESAKRNDALSKSTKKLGTKNPIPGICNVCGCTEARACERGCAWANAARTLCTRCAPRGRAA
jgi:hypothetical protein